MGPIRKPPIVESVDPQSLENSDQCLLFKGFEKQISKITGFYFKIAKNLLYFLKILLFSQNFGQKYIILLTTTITY